jgi:hypothetical protein
MSTSAIVAPSDKPTKRLGMLMVVSLSLLIAILACTTQRQSDVTPTPFRTNTPVSNVAPIIQINAPASGQTLELFKQTEIRILVEHPIGATQVLLIVNGTLEKSKALPQGTLILDNTPEPATSTSQTKFEISLLWTPTTQGTVNLKVIVYFDDLDSNVGEVNVEVSPPRAIDSDSVAQADTAIGVECAVRVFDTVDNLNVRNGAGEDTESLGYYDPGEFLRVINRGYDSIDREWFYVERSSGQQAWVVNNPTVVEYLSDSCLPLNLTP